MQKKNRSSVLKRKEPWMHTAVLCILLLFFAFVCALVYVYLPQEAQKEEAQQKLEEAVRASEGRIRVLLTTTGFSDMYHETVQITSAGGFTVTYGETEISCEAGTVWDAAAFFAAQEEQAEATGEEASVCRICAQSGITVMSITRGDGQPVYEGTIDVFNTADGFVLVNELPVETYLRYVVPSEMPASYAAEALKAQAVCARNFAWQHILNPGYPAYEADLDDSIRYQVYHNSNTTEATDAAIAATENQILMYENTLADTYYYSTSWGYTTDLSLWGSETKAYYVSHWQGEGERDGDLTDETVFARVLAEETGAYEANEAWYRWEVTIPVERIVENLRSYTDVSIEALSDIVVSERQSGGSVRELLLIGDGKPILLTSESDIRSCLLPLTEDIVRNDGSVLHGYEKLPSTFLLIEKNYSGGSLVSVTVKGGGCGHGIGMSQNCARVLAEQGMDYQSLLQYFYPGTGLRTLEVYE